MMTLAEASSQLEMDNTYAIPAFPFFGSCREVLDHDLTFRITETRETSHAATPLMGRLVELPQEDPLDYLTRNLEGLSLFGRTKEQLVLDPSLQLGSNVQFRKFMSLDHDVVPVLTLEDIKGSKLVVPPYSPPPYSNDELSPDDITSKLSSNQNQLVSNEKATFDSSSSSIEGNNEDLLDRFLTGDFGITTDVVQHTVDHPLLDLSSHHSNDVAFSGGSSLDNETSDLAFSDFPPSFDLDDDLERLTSLMNPSIEPNFLSGVANNEDLTFLPEQFLVDPVPDVSGNSVYPFEETPPRATLPFPLDTTAPSWKTLEELFEQFEKDPQGSNGGEFQSIDQTSEDPLSTTDWSIPPSLSPSYSESSQESFPYTPGARSPVFPFSSSPQSFLTQLSMTQPPDENDSSKPSHIDPAELRLDGVKFRDEFPLYLHPQVDSYYRPRSKVADIHGQIMVQVAPYPIGPPPPSPKVTRSKGKGKAQPDPEPEPEPDQQEEDASESSNSDAPPSPIVKKKKKRRVEAGKVKCEIEGCSGTFFSNWELKRHQKNLHGIGEALPSAVCPKCGRHFASRRKDSVDRHLELNACGKRNPRKPPRNRFIPKDSSLSVS